MAAVIDTNETAFERFKEGDATVGESADFQQAKACLDQYTGGRDEVGSTFRHSVQMSLDGDKLTISEWKPRRQESDEADREGTATFRQTTVTEDGQFLGAEKGEKWVEEMTRTATMHSSADCPLHWFGSHVVMPNRKGQGATMFSHLKSEGISRIETVYGDRSCALGPYLNFM
jgi:hypothetical protein